MRTGNSPPMKPEKPLISIPEHGKLTVFDLFWFGFCLLCAFLSWKYVSAYSNQTLGVICGGVGYGLSWLGIRSLSVWLKKRSMDDEVGKYKDLDKLSIEKLRSILGNELTEGSFFECEEDAQSERQKEYFPYEIARIFQRYKAIRWPFGEINRSNWHPYEFDARYIVIGTGLENSFLIS